MNVNTLILAHPALVITAYALAINLSAFLAFAWDKNCARNGTWRVPERTLLMLAAAGGSFGAFAGQQGFRHKTSKQPFRTYLGAIYALQIVAIGALCVPQIRTATASLFKSALA